MAAEGVEASEGANGICRGAERPLRLVMKWRSGCGRGLGGTRVSDSAPQVSIICTAKNAAKTICWTLDSVRSQSLPDWELIVVDDGSSDGTAQIVRGSAASDSRVRLIATAGIGRGRALNLAIEHASGEFVAKSRCGRRGASTPAGDSVADTIKVSV